MSIELLRKTASEGVVTGQNVPDEAVRRLRDVNNCLGYCKRVIDGKGGYAAFWDGGCPTGKGS